MISGVIQSGFAGYQKSVSQAESAAGQIARAAVPPEGAGAVAPEQASDVNLSARPEVPIEESLVELKLSELQARASASVIRTGDEMLGTLIDTTA